MAVLQFVQDGACEELELRLLKDEQHLLLQLLWILRGWSSSGYGIVYTLIGFIEDDGCLHISIGEQQLGSYGSYSVLLVRYTDEGIFASGEVVGSLSDDSNTITFSVSPASYLMIAAVENDQAVGWLEGYIPPFTAVKNEEQATTGGIVGTSYNTFLEKCFYGDGCKRERDTV